jgi:hypothetical protein
MITRPIPLVIRAKRDASLGNILTKTIRLEEISKNIIGYLR